MRTLLALLPALVIACTHGDTYSRDLIAPNPIRTATPPRQMTFSTEGDWSPVWLPDGSAFGYSYHVLGRSDRDRCLGFLPADGGRLTRSVCVRGPQEWDSANVVSYHAVSPGGRLALVADAGLIRLFAPSSRNLYLGRADADTGLTPVLAFPYQITSTGQQHFTATNLTWVDENTLVYLATFVNYVEGKVGVPADTVHVGIEIVRLELSGNAIISSTVMPNTLGVTSICQGTRPNTVAYTRGASSAVFELDLGTGQQRQLYDFGPLGIARDVQIAGGRIVAVAGGRASYIPFSLVFNLPYLADSGGPVYTARLPDGPPEIVIDTVGEHQFRRPALAPSGRRLVVEQFGFEFKDYGNEIRYVVSKQANLWLFEVP